MTFRDRTDAGRRLAARLEAFREDRPVVLGLARGGVPVACEVARALGAEVDVLVVRKLAAPQFPEYAVGAIAEGGAIVLNREAMRDVGLGEEGVAAIAEGEAAELARRMRALRGGRPLRELAGRTVVVVDDGVATGATARAAARAARLAGASRVILAAPVVAALSETELRADFDDVVAVETPLEFYAVGVWYDRFPQLSDEEVRAALRRTHERRASPAGDLWDGEWTAPEPRGGPAIWEERVSIPAAPARHGGSTLRGILATPPSARGLVLLAGADGATPAAARDRFVARAIEEAGLATLRFDPLTTEEAADEEGEQLRLDVELVALRVLEVIRWLRAQPVAGALPLGLAGSGPGAAAVLAAAAALPGRISAVVTRGGRLDLVPTATLERVEAPVLLVVGSRDAHVLAANRRAAGHLGRGEVAPVPGASHLFEEAGALDAVAHLAARFFARHLERPEPVPRLAER